MAIFEMLLQKKFYRFSVDSRLWVEADFLRRELSGSVFDVKYSQELVVESALGLDHEAVARCRCGQKVVNASPDFLFSIPNFDHA